ncbi:Os07g0160232 [Oryza sativa Japonica Group]|uniref:Os07g0160232 protein n=1 Tax=Oryza sativa subsp. japonica TaxID=39947 RepID=A0A0P0X361_ORYSJ|nr:Os07g0160232 [Oryza sativa Japonica Group]
MQKTSPLSSKSSPNELPLRPSSPVPAPSLPPLQLLAMVALGPGKPPPSRLSLPPAAQAPGGGAACTALAAAAPTTRGPQPAAPPPRSSPSLAGSGTQG